MLVVFFLNEPIRNSTFAGYAHHIATVASENTNNNNNDYLLLYNILALPCVRCYASSPTHLPHSNLRLI